MKHIIVPVDFSQESLSGLNMAVILANRFGGAIQMVYVQSPQELSKVNLDQERKTAKERFKQIEGDFSSKLEGGATLSHIVKKGKVFREVVNQAQAFDDSIIVCSTHGASGFEELFIGSNALKIISATELPVIAIRHGAIPRPFGTIVLPIDLTTDTRQKVPITAKLALAFDAEIHVLGVSSAKNDDTELKIKAYTKQVCDYLKEHKVRYKQTTSLGGNVCEQTLNYALDCKADLISIMTEQDEGFSSWVLGTQAQQLLNRSSVPVLAVTPKELFILGSFGSPGSNF